MRSVGAKKEWAAWGIYGIVEEHGHHEPRKAAEDHETSEDLWG